MTTVAGRDPFYDERVAWLRVVDGGWCQWHPATHRLFVWRPGAEAVDVYHEHEKAAPRDRWLLPEGRLLSWQTAEATIAERLRHGY